MAWKIQVSCGKQFADLSTTVAIFLAIRTEPAADRQIPPLSNYGLELNNEAMWLAKNHFTSKVRTEPWNSSANRQPTKAVTIILQFLILL